MLSRLRKRIEFTVTWGILRKSKGTENTRHADGVRVTTSLIAFKKRTSSTWHHLNMGAAVKGVIYLKLKEFMVMMLHVTLPHDGFT